MNMERNFFAHSPTEAVDDSGDDEIENEEGNRNLFLHRDATLKNEKKRKTGAEMTGAGSAEEKTEDKTSAEGVEDKTGADGAEDKTGAGGAEEKTGAEGAEDKTGADGAEDKTGADGAEDKTDAEGVDGIQKGLGED